MKKLAFIAIVFMVSFTHAQEKMHSKQKMQDYSPEDMAQIQTKQLTLDLDLTVEQQKQVEQLFLENAKTRKAKQEQGSMSKKEMTSEEKLQMKNESLDRQIEMKKKMKSILDEKQYEKWEKIREENKKTMHQNHKKKASMSEQKQ